MLKPRGMGKPRIRTICVKEKPKKKNGNHMFFWVFKNVNILTNVTSKIYSKKQCAMHPYCRAVPPALNKPTYFLNI